MLFTFAMIALFIGKKLLVTDKFHPIEHLILRVDQKVYVYLTKFEAHCSIQELQEMSSILLKKWNNCYNIII